MELLLLVFAVVGISRWAAKHDQTLLTKDEYNEIWRNSPFGAGHYEGIVDRPKPRKRRWLFLR